MEYLQSTFEHSMEFRMSSELIHERMTKSYNSWALAKPRAKVSETEPRILGNPLSDEFISSALGDVAQ